MLSYAYTCVHTHASINIYIYRNFQHDIRILEYFYNTRCIEKFQRQQRWGYEHQHKLLFYFIIIVDVDAVVVVIVIVVVAGGGVVLINQNCSHSQSANSISIPCILFLFAIVGKNNILPQMEIYRSIDIRTHHHTHFLCHS